MRKLYLVTAVLATLLPCRYLIRFLMPHGLDMSLLFRQLFQNDISAFFGLDVIVSSVVLWLFVFSEGKRLGMKQLWVYKLTHYRGPTLLVQPSQYSLEWPGPMDLSELQALRDCIHN